MSLVFLHLFALRQNRLCLPVIFSWRGLMLYLLDQNFQPSEKVFSQLIVTFKTYKKVIPLASFKNLTCKCFISSLFRSKFSITLPSNEQLYNLLPLPPQATTYSHRYYTFLGGPLSPSLLSLSLISLYFGRERNLEREKNQTWQLMSCRTTYEHDLFSVIHSETCKLLKLSWKLTLPWFINPLCTIATLLFILLYGQIEVGFFFFLETCVKINGTTRGGSRDRI